MVVQLPPSHWYIPSSVIQLRLSLQSDRAPCRNGVSMIDQFRYYVNHSFRVFFIYLWRYIGSWPPWSCCGRGRCYKGMIKMLTTSGWWWTYNEEGDDDKDGNDDWMIIDLVSQHLQRNCPSRVSHSPSRLQFLGKISVNVLLFTSPRGAVVQEEIQTLLTFSAKVMSQTPD